MATNHFLSPPQGPRKVRKSPSLNLDAIMPRSDTIRVVIPDENDDDVFAPERPAHKLQKPQTMNATSSRNNSRRRDSKDESFPPTLVAFLQDTSDFPALARQNKKTIGSSRENKIKSSEDPEDLQTPRGPENINSLLQPSTLKPPSPPRYAGLSAASHPARLPGLELGAAPTTTTNNTAMATTARPTTAMAKPAGLPATSSKHINTASPLSGLIRHALIETYTANSIPPSPTPPLASTTIPLSSNKRLAQQSTEDFVMRTSRSMARDQAVTMQYQQHPHQQHQNQQTQQRRSSIPSHVSANSASSAAYTPQMVAMPQPFPKYYTGSSGAHFQWQRPAPIKPVKRRAPGEMFASLPGEVLELILDELKKLHLDTSSSSNDDAMSCATCWMRDACAVAIAARKMLKYARVAIYESVEIVGADSSIHLHNQRKKSKSHHQPQPSHGAARLTLLLRTLHASPQIAAIVRSLKVPALSLSSGSPIPDDLETLVASVVMACPNLERVVGFYPTYEHSTHSRYFQALSTRPRLKEMTWIIEPILSKEQLQERQQLQELLQQQQQKQQRSRARSFSAMIRPHALPSPPASPRLNSSDESPFASATNRPAITLEPRQSARFLNHHVNWQYLTTLTVHCKAGATLAPGSALLVDALMYLPTLQNLYLSHLPRDAFDDAALLMLPPLRKLSLVDLPGITSDGLSAFATRGTSRSLVALSLIHINLDSLPVLARILSKLASLATFSFVQDQSPTLTPGEVIWLFPYLASASLRSLHWDVPTFGDRANAADVALARSIAAEGFPQLRQLRTPADPEGIFQALCRPQYRVDLPSDRIRSFGGGSTYYPTYPVAFSSSASSSSSSSPPSASHRHRHSESSSVSSASVFSSSLAHSRTNSSTGSFSGTGSNRSSPGSSPSLPQAGGELQKKHTSSKAQAARRHSDLHFARMAAQARIDASRRTPRFFVNVTDEQNRLVDKFGLGGFVGTIGSRITYHLLPDAGASDAKGGLVGLDDFLGDGGERVDGASGSSSKRDDTGGPVKACNGQWNADWDMPQKKDRERWLHTERGRWRAVKLI